MCHSAANDILRQVHTHTKKKPAESLSKAAICVDAIVRFSCLPFLLSCKSDLFFPYSSHYLMTNLFEIYPPVFFLSGFRCIMHDIEKRSGTTHLNIIIACQGSEGNIIESVQIMRSCQTPTFHFVRIHFDIILVQSPPYSAF